MESSIIAIIIKWKLFLFGNILGIVVGLFEYLREIENDYKFRPGKFFVTMVLLGILSEMAYMSLELITYYKPDLPRSGELDYLYSASIAFFVFYIVPLLYQYRLDIFFNIGRLIKSAFSKLLEKVISSYGFERKKKDNDDLFK